MLKEYISKSIQKKYFSFPKKNTFNHFHFAFRELRIYNVFLYGHNLTTIVKIFPFIKLKNGTIFMVTTLGHIYFVIQKQKIFFSFSFLILYYYITLYICKGI